MAIIDLTSDPELVQQLAFSQLIETEFVPDPTREKITHNITVTSTIVNDQTRSTIMEAVVTQTIDFAIDPKRLIAQSLGFVEIIIARIVRKRAGTGSHSLSSGTIDPPIQTYYDSLVRPAKVTFTYGITSVQIRAPKFKDKDKYEVYRVQNDSRGGDLIIFQDSLWPKTEILELEFDYLSETESISMLAFLKISLGKSITYIDHYGRTWHGFILTPDAKIVQKGRSNFSIKLNFQGTL